MTSTQPSTSGGAPAPCSETPGHVCRRAVLSSAGVVGVGVVLAGCGAAQGSADGGAGQASDQGSDAVRGVISKSVVPVGGGRVFPDQRVVVTQPSSGEFKAFSAICTHQGCIVSDVSGGTINCGCHGSQFDIATGDVRRGPATQPLPGKTVSVGSNGITVS